MKKSRAAEELVAQGFFVSVDQATRAIMAGQVSTCDRRIEKPGEMIVPGTYLHVKDHNRFVSRGGLKLEGALDVFSVNVADKHCLDIGCSTGGFTDCLLRSGAESVIAVDVGYAQFDWDLRCNPKITLLERTNIVDVQDYDNYFDLAVCDVSFTSVERISSAPSKMLKPGGYFLTLVKPQFEVARELVGAKGIVDNPCYRFEALRKVVRHLQDTDFAIRGLMTSPIKGTKGNVEYFAYAQKSPEKTSVLDDAIWEVIDNNKTILFDCV